MCRHQSHPIKVTSSSGLLASVVTMETGCGGVGRPWHVEALPGQRINVTLVDFTRQHRDAPNHVPNGTGCRLYAVIREVISDSVEVVCNSPTRRLWPVYMSVHNFVEIEIRVPKKKDDDAFFALSFQGENLGRFQSQYLSGGISSLQGSTFYNLAALRGHLLHLQFTYTKKYACVYDTECF